MVRPDRDEHAWERLCARKRDEIERDTRLLSTQQQQRCERAERLYAELESAHAHTEDKDEEICEDGVLDLRGKELKVFTVPAAVERTLATRDLHTLILRNNRLQHLDARTLAPLVALRSPGSRAAAGSSTRCNGSPSCCSPSPTSTTSASTTLAST